MNADTYQEYRGRLVAILERCADLMDKETLPGWPEAAQQLQNMRRKLVEDQFAIVLLAEMQGGKSTIFDAVACDGRELSPLGSMLRTSGCEVRAQNLADDEKQEYAEVAWRTPEELIAGFDNLLRPRFSELAPERFDGENSIADRLELDQLADRELLRQAAERERDRWNEDRTRYDPQMNGYMDVFRFALLVAAFFDHEEVKTLRQRSRFKLDE
jgi:hypothetical protein